MVRSLGDLATGTLHVREQSWQMDMGPLSKSVLVRPSFSVSLDAGCPGMRSATRCPSPAELVEASDAAQT